MDKELAGKIAEIAVKQCKAGVDFRQPRLDEIKKNEDMYLNAPKPKLVGRFNVPIDSVIMGGFVDTLMSKIDDPPSIKYGHQTEADYKLAKLFTAAWQKDSSTVAGRWSRKDRGIKKLAILSGRGINKFFCESEPEYKANFKVVDYNDFVCEPQGGGDLEDHMFAGQLNIFKSDSDLESKLYDQTQVKELKDKSENEAKEVSKKNGDLFNNRVNRFRAMGLQLEGNEYVGSKLYNLTEWVMVYNGIRYYLLFDYSTGVWVRCAPLKEVTKSNLMPWTSWATHEDPFNFWSKAPADDIRPIAESLRIVFNGGLENLNKNNWNMRAVDPNIFPNIADLEWRPNGIAVADTKNGTRRISDGIYEFQTPDRTSLVVNLTQYLDNFLGQKSGITAGAQGASDENTKVGVYYGDMQQVADRLGLYNKSYVESWEENGLKYIWGLIEHAPEKMVVKVVGEKGVEWDELRRDMIGKEPNMDVQVIGGKSEEQANELRSKRKAESLSAITGNPVLINKLNPEWIIEQNLRNGGYDDDEIKSALNTDNYGEQEIMSEAAQENEDIISGKSVKPNRGATTAHIQKHIDFAYDNELEDDIFAKIIAHADSEMNNAAENMARKAMRVQPQTQSPATGNEVAGPTNASANNAPVPNNPLNA